MRTKAQTGSNRWPMAWLHLAAFLVLIAGGGSGAAENEPAKTQRDSKPPNVLFIAIDDLNNRLGCYGDAVVLSPNIDKLAAKGRKFERAYCQYPLCNPSRTSMLTGMRPEVTKIMDNGTPPRSVMPDMMTMPDWFRKHGYESVSVGKIFHGRFPDPKSWDKGLKNGERDGFEEDENAVEESRPRKGKRGAGAGKEAAAGRNEKPGRKQQAQPKRANREETQIGAGVAKDEPDSAELDGKSALAAAEYLEGAHEKPFFLAVGFHKPHLPWIAPKKYFDLYDPEKLTLAQSPPGDRDDIPPMAISYGKAQNAKPFKDQRSRNAIRAYFACISFMDAQVGIVLDALEKSGHADNTIVVFWSDHGYHLGEHGGLWRKMSLFEESARTPLIIYKPGLSQPGKPTASLAEALDFFPTLVDLCGVPAPSGLMGKSLRPVLDDPAASVKDHALTIVRREAVVGKSVRTSRWRYTEWGGPEAAELYDHDNDPHEYRNLAKDPAQMETIAKLREKLGGSAVE